MKMQAILEKVKSYLDNIKSFENYKEFEVFKGRKNMYNILEVNEDLYLPHYFHLVWFFHYKLYLPLFLISFIVYIIRIS